MTTLTYGALPETAHASVFIICTNLGCEEYETPYAASRGDYFMCDPRDVVLCAQCHEPMTLARKVTTIVRVDL